MVLIYHAILSLVSCLIIFYILYVRNDLIWLHFHIFSGVFEEKFETKVLLRTPAI